MTGTELIAAERQRQIEVEGWTQEHDDEHEAGQLAAAARCYTKTAQLQVCRLASRKPGRPEFTWPWDDDAWKPSDDPIRNLVKAGALIAAEIDRLQRAKDTLEMEQKLDAIEALKALPVSDPDKFVRCRWCGMETPKEAGEICDQCCPF